MSKLGRPSKFSLELAERIYFLASKGLTDKEISYVANIDEVTLNRWKKSDTFCKSLKESKEVVDKQVEGSLLRRALGHDLIEKHVTTDSKGNVTTREISKFVPADTTAAIFWLKNRKREQWGSQITQLLPSEPSNTPEAADIENENLFKRMQAIDPELMRNFERVRLMAYCGLGSSGETTSEEFQRELNVRSGDVTH